MPVIFSSERQASSEYHTENSDTELGGSNHESEEEKVEPLPRGLHVVEAIRRHQRRDEDGEIVYFVKWSGYPESENSWEPECNFVGSGALALLRAYQVDHNLNVVPELSAPPARRSGDVVFKELMEAGCFPNGDPLDIEAMLAFPPGTKRVKELIRGR